MNVCLIINFTVLCVCFHGVHCGQFQAFDVYITPISSFGLPKVSKTVLFILIYLLLVAMNAVEVGKDVTLLMG